MLAIAMGVLLLTMLGIVLVAMRKRTSPQPTPPLHPEASVNVRMSQSATATGRAPSSSYRHLRVGCDSLAGRSSPASYTTSHTMQHELERDPVWLHNKNYHPKKSASRLKPRSTLLSFQLDYAPAPAARTRTSGRRLCAI